MKSPRVDIFRPLAAATRGCRPSASATSIFRRNHHHHHSNNKNNSNSHGNSNNSQTQQQQQQQQRTGNPQTSTSEEDEEESFVVSVPPGAWPPHRNAFGSGSSAADGSSAQHEALDIAAPLPTATSSGDDRGSGASPAGDSSRSRRSSSASRGESKSPSKRGKSKQQPQQSQPISRPSYYKIELAEGSGGACRLTSGDDSSVVLTADHNELLQLADDGNVNGDLGVSGRIRPSPRGIIRASPIVEQLQQQQHNQQQQLQQLLQLESIEHKVEGGPEHSITYSPSKKRQSARQRWTISDNGTIIAVPPSPSSVSASRFQQTSSAAAAEPSKHPEEGDDNGHDDNDNFSIPPLLAKASNGSSDDSFVSADSSSEEDNQTFEKAVAARNSEGSSQLESPPRMNRSAIGHSLFQESLSSKESDDEHRRNNNDPIKGCMSNRSKSSKSTDQFVSGGAGCCAATYGRSGSRGRSRSPDDKQQGRGGGCGARGPLLFGEFFGQILDVFSLNGGCCHQQQQQQSQSQRNSSSGNAGAAY